MRALLRIIEKARKSESSPCYRGIIPRLVAHDNGTLRDTRYIKYLKLSVNELPCYELFFFFLVGDKVLPYMTLLDSTLFLF